MFKTRYKSHHDAEHEYGKLIQKRPSSLEELAAYLDNPKAVSVKENAIYIHVPFCDRICSFCNMNRKIIDDSIDTYVEQLTEQILWMGNHLYFQQHKIVAVYFGGGTPTVLSPEHYKRILTALRQSFLIDANCEITSETTLHNLSDAHLQMFATLGVNRLSIGIQTFQTAGRKFFNRTYDKEQTIKRLQEIRQVFKGCLSVDKIYNYPGETKEMLLDDVEQIINLEIDSVSFYSLMIHQGSKLSDNLQASDFSSTQDQKFHDLFVDTLLNRSDFEFLELTKMARKGRDRYYYMNVRNSNGNTIPLGRGAGGQIDAFQMYNMDFNRIMMVHSEDDKNEIASKIYGIFQSPIIEKTQLEAVSASKALQKGIGELIEQGYLKETNTTWEMNEAGIFYGNNIGGFLARKYLEVQTELETKLGAKKQIEVETEIETKIKTHAKTKEREQVEQTIADFVASFHGAVMATTSENGTPHLSTIATIKQDNNIYTLISPKAPHYCNLKQKGEAQIIFAEDMHDMENAFVRKRLSYQVTATFVETEDTIITAFQKVHGDIIEMVCKIGFEFVALKINGGQIILGPAQSYHFDENESLLS